jgi:hypothetical protein
MEEDSVTWNSLYTNFSLIYPLFMEIVPHGGIERCTVKLGHVCLIIKLEQLKD